jgi:hypothetical protein
MGAVYRRRVEFDLLNCLLKADAPGKRAALIMKVLELLKADGL